METSIIGAVIISSKNEEGIIIDKARGYCNNASPTIYICMDKNGKVFQVSYNEIKEIKSFITHPNNLDFSIYLNSYKKK